VPVVGCQRRKRGKVSGSLVALQSFSSSPFLLFFTSPPSKIDNDNEDEHDRRIEEGSYPPQIVLVLVIVLVLAFPSLFHQPTFKDR
jgi:hypothetical protein